MGLSSPPPLPAPSRFLAIPELERVLVARDPAYNGEPVWSPRRFEAGVPSPPPFSPSTLQASPHDVCSQLVDKYVTLYSDCFSHLCCPAWNGKATRRSLVLPEFEEKKKRHLPAVRSRISSKLIFASCVQYFDRGRFVQVVYHVVMYVMMP